MYMKYHLAALPRMVHHLCGARHFQVENHWSKLDQENKHFFHNWPIWPMRKSVTGYRNQISNYKHSTFLRHKVIRALPKRNSRPLLWS